MEKAKADASRNPKVQKQKAVRADKKEVPHSQADTKSGRGGKRTSGVGHADKRGRDSSGSRAGDGARNPRREQGHRPSSGQNDSGRHSEKGRGDNRTHQDDAPEEITVRGTNERLKAILPDLKAQLSNIVSRNNRLLATARPGKREKRMRLIGRSTNTVRQLRARIRFIEGRLAGQ